MSENLDLVRSIYADWERGNFSATGWAHPDIEFVMDGGEGSTPINFTGVAGMAEGFRDFLSTWKDYRLSADQYRELDDDRVLVLNCLSGRSKSGLDLGGMKTRTANLFQVRDGRVTRLALYSTRDRALADLGLKE
jgi:ketosteroid isomerase-like protein